MSGSLTYTFHDGSKADGLTPEQYKSAKEWDRMNSPVNLNAAQQVAKVAADVLPAVGGALGTTFGFTGGAAATAPMLGAGSVPGAIYGGLAGTGMGVAGQEALYGLAGIPHDKGLGAFADRLAKNAAVGMLGAPMQAAPMALAAASPKVAPAVMKTAIGNAQPEAEAAMLKWNIPANSAGVKMARKLMDTAMASRKAALDGAEANGWGVSFKSLLRVLRTRARRYADADLLSTEGEAALARAEKVLMEKIGRGEQVGERAVALPGSGGAQGVTSVTLGRPGRAVGVTGRVGSEGKPLVVTGASGAPSNTAPVYAPAPRLTPSRLEEIKEHAQTEARALYEARQGVKGSSPSAMERGYEAIAAEAQRALERIPGVKSANASYAELKVAEKAAYEAAKRSPARRAVAAGMGAAFGPAHALLTGDPRFMLESLPAAGAAAVLSDAGNLSRMALTLNNPGTMGRAGIAAGTATRLPETALRILGLLSPEVTNQPEPGQ